MEATPWATKHIREKHLLVIRLQGRKVDPLIKDKENYTATHELIWQKGVKAKNNQLFAGVRGRIRDVKKKPCTEI